MTSYKRWLITGCSTGLGRALANTVLENGDQAVITARNVATLQPLVERHGDRVRPLSLDLTQPGQIAAAARQAEAAFGGIDVLVNNAGYGLIGAIEETGPEDYRPLFETNFFGTMELTRALLPAMRQHRSGRIVNVSSIAAFAPRPGYGFYAAAKAALESASESLAVELAPFGITVTLVEPGPFRTDWAGRSLQFAATVIDDYAGTTGASRKAVKARNGHQPGSPELAAEAIVAAVCAEQPPRRLPLGSYAYQRLREKLAAMQRELDAWEPRAGAAVEFR